MLPEDNRITSKKDFEKIKQQGKIIHSTSFSLVVLNTKTNSPSRFGFIVSTKISPNATIRNKSKRALREGVRQILSFSNPGYDCVILAKPIIVKRYTHDLIHEVKDVLTRSGVIK